MLPSRHRQFLLDVPDLDVPGAPGDTAAVGHAALVAHVCVNYRTAFSANELAERLRERHLCPPGASLTEVLDNLVRPLFEAFRTARSPLADWWAPDQLDLLVSTWYASCRLAAADEASVRTELAERWGHGQLGVEAIVGEALLPSPVVPTLLRKPEAGSPLTAVWALTEISRTFEAGAARLPPAVAIHDELHEAALATVRYRVLKQHRDGLTAIVADLGPRLERAGEELKRNVERFTAYEVGLLVEIDDDERLLRASVDALRNVRHISSTGVNAPADGYRDALLVPDWLTEVIVSAGGRIGHRSCGPIPYWFAALELSELPDEVRTGEAQAGMKLLELEIESGLCEFAIEFHVRGEKRVVGFHFTDALEDAMQLALIAVTGLIRLDFFLLGAEGRLELIHSAPYRLSGSPLRARIRRAALEGLHGRAADAEDLLNAWFQQIPTDLGAGGFIASDRAKAEELLALRASFSASDERSASRYLEARDRWLTASDSLARAKLVTIHVGELETKVRQALADYQLALGDRDPRPGSDDEKTLLNVLVEGLVDADHAFLHLNRTQDYLDAFICTHGADGPIAERLDVSSTPLYLVEQALDAWEAGEPASLVRVMDSVGTGLGQTIADVLLDRDVGHLFVSAFGFLNRLPLGLLQLGDGRHLEDICQISYAPSARVLQRLRAQDDQPARGTVALAFDEGGDIPLTGSEVAVVELLSDRAVVLQGSEATAEQLLAAARDARILHLACHGVSQPEDPFASGLFLAGETPQQGYVSIAQLHRDADLTGVQLVVLSACFTGWADTRWPQVHSYAAIDGAFLTCGARCVISTLWEVYDLAGLLFSTAFHHELATNGSVSKAFAHGVETLRAKRYLNLDGSAEAALLDACAADWREQVAEVGDGLAHPYYWAVFKLSGLPPVISTN
jgi:CHAT domain-containing protein